MKMSDVVTMVESGDKTESDVVVCVMSAWSEMIEEVCERLDNPEQCATVRSVAVEWGFEIHPTSGVCVDASKVSE